MKLYRSVFVAILVIIAVLSGCNPLISPTALSATAAPVKLTSIPPTVVKLPTASLVPSPTAIQLTTEMLRNLEYSLPVYQKTIRLKDGKYEGGSGSDYLLVVLADVSAFGDLNGDGMDDAALILAENGGGSGMFESLVVILNQGGTPAQFGAVLLGDRVLIKTITIRDRYMILDMVVQGPNDSFCCPTRPEIQTYALAKGGLVLSHLTSQTPDGAVREIHIESPAAGTKVDASVQVKGSVTIAPFENTLAYRLYDQMNNKLDEGPLMVQAPDMGSPGTFDVAIDLAKVPAGLVFRLEIVDLSMADGAILALDSVEMIRK